MKRKKICLENVGQVLSPDEMKQIMAGSDGCPEGSFECSCDGIPTFCARSVQECINFCNWP